MNHKAPQAVLQKEILAAHIMKMLTDCSKLSHLTFVLADIAKDGMPRNPNYAQNKSRCARSKACIREGTAPISPMAARSGEMGRS